MSGADACRSPAPPRPPMAGGALALLALLHAPCALAYDAADRYAVWGAGRQSCHSYLQARASGGDTPYRTFLEGYLTAYNSFTPDTYRVSGEHGLGGVLERVDEECEAHPIASFELALRRVVHALAPERARRAPGRRRGGWSW